MKEKSQSIEKVVHEAEIIALESEETREVISNLINDVNFDTIINNTQSEMQVFDEQLLILEQGIPQLNNWVSCYTSI